MFYLWDVTDFHDLGDDSISYEMIQAHEDSMF